MSRYYSFNDFMNDVIEEADKISESRSGCGLEELYHVKVKTYEAVRRLISKDWFVFIVVVVLLAGTDRIGAGNSRFSDDSGRVSGCGCSGCRFGCNDKTDV